MNKKIIKPIVFILILCILVFIITKICWLDPTSITYFYKEPNNSIDIVYLGSSNAHHHFNSTLAYNEYGFTTGFLSTDSQAFPLTKYCIEEARKYQSPELYIIDIVKVCEDTETFDKYDTFSDESIRRTTDSFKFSQNRINAINDLLSYREDIPKEDYKNFYFSFFIYHNRWKQIPGMLKRVVLGNAKEYYKGYKFIEENSSIEPYEKYIWTEKITSLSEKNKEVLIDLINYIKDKNLNVLFVVPIRCYKTELNEKINDAIRIINENNLNIINFNTLEDFNTTIDFSTDLYNERHLNVYGATKYTLYFSKYLKDNYDLKDHRDDKDYDSWKVEYNEFKKKFKKITDKDFENLLEEV